MKNQEFIEHIKSLDELSLYLEFTKIKARLNIKEYNNSIVPEENPRIKNEIQEIQGIISLYEKQIQALQINNDKKRATWENACSTFLNQLSILEYAVLMEEKESQTNLFAFYPKESKEESFLHPTTRNKIREKIMKRKVS